MMYWPHCHKEGDTLAGDVSTLVAQCESCAVPLAPTAQEDELTAILSHLSPQVARSVDRYIVHLEGFVAPPIKVRSRPSDVKRQEHTHRGELLQT